MSKEPKVLTFPSKKNPETSETTEGLSLEEKMNKAFAEKKLREEQERKKNNQSVIRSYRIKPKKV